MGFVGVGALAGLQVAGATLDTIEQNKNIRAQKDFQTRRYLAIREAAIDSFHTQGTQVRSRQAQERAQITEEIRNLTADSLRRRGQAAASAGTAEVAGQSVTDVQLDFLRAEQNTQGRLRQLQESREAAAEFQLRNIGIQTQARIAGALPAPIPTPNPFGQALNIVTSGFEGAAAGQGLFL